ncbi:hypothetical protein GCM10010387_12450 [Streptomyces inusitatus]|uniref:Uncharacterized protein n=1 Tax=Streptomyces inusitatus TaxID=68221 RepID=A0A918PSA7_9ACTN|nr:hypothetical protein [Streptomyces inusitatus]GGZ20956.1 hypothetical protein GCM10010387_12450 [Streptomyces inusitatus]
MSESEAPEKPDSVPTAWREWQDAPWGRLRYAVAEANLVRDLDAPGEGRPLRVLDLAGGDGGDAVRLAARDTTSPSSTTPPPCSPPRPSGHRRAAWRS